MKWQIKILNIVLTTTLILMIFPSFTLGSTEMTSSSEIIKAENQLKINLENEDTTIEQPTEEEFIDTEKIPAIVEDLDEFDDTYLENVDLNKLSTNIYFKALDIKQEEIEMYIEIEDYIKENEKDSIVETIQYFDKKFGNEPTTIGITANAAYKEIYSEWTKLNTKEKVLVASNPKAAALTKTTQSKAFEYTRNKFSYNGLGDKSDAFRHAIWNALMCRYVDKSWAYLYATAHEDKSSAELKKKAADGYLESQHRNMDLHNNQKGRDCWYWNSGILWTSNDTLISRVNKKLNNGELTWLHK
ncbi:DUF6973 domain-containing protein [Gottfriedia sp. NPDC058432]|uniref:DUF6973 domain-containing protein n=1 Tax=Gottfriedia sp. NPDC058432 TaxID=3346497 RepID=UPI003647279F